MSSSSSSVQTWIDWYLSLKGNEIFCKVDEAYIKDKFNLTGLPERISDYNEAMELVLDMDADEIYDSPTEGDRIEDAAEMVYGLIHARFILTYEGLSMMAAKQDHGDFGFCPRVFCENQALLPTGLSDFPNEQIVKMYCPKCMDIYNSKSARHANIDGAYFGTSFVNMMYMTFPERRPKLPTRKFEPRIHGFKIHPSAYQIQQQAKPRTKNTRSGVYSGISNTFVRRRY